MVEPGLEDVFPGLRGQPHEARSPRDDHYNCIAWAAGDNRNWWWPDLAQEDNWPAGVPGIETLRSIPARFCHPWPHWIATTASWKRVTKRLLYSLSPVYRSMPPGGLAQRPLDEQAGQNGRHRTHTSRR